ncbi:hypothetical protein SEA_NICEHOUSE_220 [Rhodococcus phage NiceHouse]|nr:hypothetical protein SEA_NICEHOUSE_220 [Rhodococcus phage NiceHouse]
MNDEDQYIVLCHELGVLGIGVQRSYGMDVTAVAEGIEFDLVFDSPDEYHIVGEFFPISDNEIV